MSNVVEEEIPIEGRFLATEAPALSHPTPATMPATLTLPPAPKLASSTSTTTSLAPVRPQERIESVDVLRGAALLGILLLNINSFGLPFAATSDPSTSGGADGANLAVWFTNHVLFEGKMRAIFSMLFGASVIIMTSRASRRPAAGVEVADIYYRRTLWLIAFGVIHAYLIWYGDILFHYGVVGLTLFPFRKLSGRTLCIIGVMLLGVHSAHAVRGAHRFRDRSVKVARYEAMQQAGQPLTAEQQSELRAAKEARNDFKPDEKTLEEEIRTTRSGFWTNLRARASVAATMQSDIFYRVSIWDIAGMLVLGMGLMKLGVFDASRSFRFYTWMAIIGYGVGLPLAVMLGVRWMRSNFDLPSMFAYIKAPSDLVRFSIAAGHVAVIMLICKANALRPVTQTLSKVGRMALSNYLLTSVLCTLFFYGFGWGMFGKLQRFELLYVVAAVWAINLAFSAAWLKYFRFGPLEWIWRSLTYGKLQPMLVHATAGPSGTSSI